MDAYETRKKALGLIDFADMITGAECKLRTDHAVRQAVLDEVDCVIIDEFQDTNPVQFALLWQMGGHAPRTLLVGDVKQSIMGSRALIRAYRRRWQQLANPEDYRRALGLFTLHRHKTHSRAHRRFTDCFGIGSIIFLALDERLDVGRRDQPNVMAQLADFARPEVSTATRFHRDTARRQLPEELQHLCSPQLLAQHCTARAVCAMHLEHILCQPIGDCYAFACQPTDRIRP